MAGFIISKKLTRKEADDAIVTITRFFELHPNRRICRTDLGWSVRRGHVVEDVEKHLETK